MSEFAREALLPWHPLVSQAAGLSQLLEVSKEESSQPSGTSSDPANSKFFIQLPGLDSTLHMVLLRASLNQSACISPQRPSPYPEALLVKIPS